MCLFAMLAGLFPRVAFAIYWIARPNAIEAAFGGMLLWPLLGLVFLPFTTLMYTLLWSATGLSGWDWLWVGIAFLLDIGHYGYSAYGNRDRIPGYGSSA
jgi:hypothetical protein